MKHLRDLLEKLATIRFHNKGNDGVIINQILLNHTEMKLDLTSNIHHLNT